MSEDGKGIKWGRKIAENFNRLTRAHERYRRQTDRRQRDGRAIAYSEREREFTFAKKYGNVFYNATFCNNFPNMFVLSANVTLDPLLS